LLNDTANYLALKTFNFNVAYTLSVDIAVDKRDLIKDVIED
jgi:hypothetical protein